MWKHQQKQKVNRKQGSSPRKFNSIQSRLTKHLPHPRPWAWSGHTGWTSVAAEALQPWAESLGWSKASHKRGNHLCTSEICFLFFSLWKDVLGSSLPGSRSFPAPAMRFPKDINSLFYHVESAEDATTDQQVGLRKGASRHRERWARQGAWGQGAAAIGWPVRAPRSGREGRG